MIRLTRILVASDFSEVADAALAYGRELARSFGAELEVVHVTESLASRAAATSGYPDYLGTLERVQIEIVQAAEAALAERVSEEDRVRLKASWRVLTSGTPAAAIVEHARETRADLIVAGTHGRGGVAQLLIGSVAERIVRTAPCPVLTVRQPQHEFIRPDALVPR